MRRERGKGSVLILALALVAVLTLVATAFIITARLESRAATNGLRGVQAEASCRSGLAAAIYRIELTGDLYSNLDDEDKWHAYWEKDEPLGVRKENLCPTSWVDHYGDGRMKGRRWPMPRVSVLDGSVKRLKRIRGFAAEYYVAVADLDGKLRTGPKNWIDPTLLADADIQEMYKSLFVAAHGDARAQTIATDIVSRVEPLWSLGQMRPTFSLADKDELTSAESALTTYPRKLLAGEHPAVNVNTARRDVLKAVVLNVPGLNQDDGTGVLYADRVADKLISNRPFESRKDMEKALVELGQKAWNGSGTLPAGYTAEDDKLSEQQLNDLLNNLAGDNSAAIDESELDRAAKPGLYSRDFDNSETGDHTKGDHTALATDDETVAATWGTEVKFVSRFYHIYVLGRTVADDAEQRVMSERRLHAVYDAGTRRVLWLRWNHEAKANAGY